MVSFRAVQSLQGARVRMCFTDGAEIVATLLSATSDLDGSRHLIYDEVEWIHPAVPRVTGNRACFYAEAATLLSIEAAGELHAGTA